MAAQAKHRQAILSAAAGLFRRQGYAATGLADIVSASGAPKGSVYHYFPSGKREIGAAAVTLAGSAVAELLATAAAETATAGALVRLYGTRLAEDLERTGWAGGCPIATVLLETAPAEATIADAGQAAFASWQAVFEHAALADGVAEAQARRLATLAVAGLEGALILARVAQSSAPILEVAEDVAALFDAASR